MPPRRRPGGPPVSSNPQGGPPRRRSALDFIPQGIEPPFKVLGVADRHMLISAAEPMELVVMQGFTQQIDQSFQKFKGRGEDFWRNHPELIETARKLDEILARVQARKAGA
jgi:hypothetical protein